MSNHPIQVPPYIRAKISEGEHQQLDFKFTVNDSRKIAITLVAFANTDGGTLLIGIKDNGVVAGINLEEESHMLEAAARMYCVPPVEYHTQAWRANNRYVLEVVVPPSSYKPHQALGAEGEATAYLRSEDKNYPAPGVMLEYWRTIDEDLPGRYFHTDRERKLFGLLSDERGHTVSELSRKTTIPRKIVTKLLARFMRWELVTMTFEHGQARFSATGSL
jgi:hypothetical protein